MTAHSTCNLNYKIPKKIPVKIHNGSKYDYHFIIKELAGGIKVEFECLGENTEKYSSFSVPIKIQKNIVVFQFQLKKNMIIIKQLHTKQSLLILVDSCQVNYQILLITCLKLIIKIAKHV